MTKYDIAISFAGEQRSIAESLATRLDASGYSVFYDYFEQAELWGSDLSILLASVYSSEARFCLVIVSEDYLKKEWTNFERQHAISRFMKSHSDYILCLKTDDTSLPGLPDVTGYISLVSHSKDDVFKLLLQKLGKPNHTDLISHLNDKDIHTARGILEACFKRAIFTRMESEISMNAMNESLAHTHSIVQVLASTISDPSLGQAALSIITALDSIERITNMNPNDYSCNFHQNEMNKIDNQKIEIVRLLLKIRRAAGIPMQLPYNLKIDHFYNLEDANASPISQRD